MRHRGHSAAGRRVQRPAARREQRPPESGRHRAQHRAQPAPGYPWLRAAGTVGLATVVPFTGGWVAVAALTVDPGGPSTTHNTAGSALAAGTAHVPQQTASPAVVLNRSLSPSLERVTRSGGRTPLDERFRQPAGRVRVPVGPTAPPSARHRADGGEEALTAPAAGGRHRGDPDSEPTTTPRRADADGEQDSDQHSGQDTSGDSGGGQDSGPEQDGSAGDDNGRHGEGGNAYGHERGQSHGNANGHDDEAQDDAGSDGSDGSDGSEDQGSSDRGSSQDGADHGGGNAYGHSGDPSGGHSGDPSGDHGDGEGSSASSGNGRGR